MGTLVTMSGRHERLRVVFGPRGWTCVMVRELRSCGSESHMQRSVNLVIDGGLQVPCSNVRQQLAATQSLLQDQGCAVLTSHVLGKQKGLKGQPTHINTISTVNPSHLCNNCEVGLSTVASACHVCNRFRFSTWPSQPPVTR